jgi:hypothetical protein
MRGRNASFSCSIEVIQRAITRYLARCIFSDGAERHMEEFDFSKNHPT